MRLIRLVLLSFVTGFLLTSASPSLVVAQAPGGLTEQALQGFAYRNLGPFRAGSWIADIAVPDAPLQSHLYTMYVAVRYGGLWKTTNNGTTFSLVFPGASTSSMGCVSVAPSDENVVWLGTGDASQVRVSMPGDGVYKSVDAGKTWQKMGLPDTQHIARIVIHPTKPDIVYVAAMGHLWSPNEERGVFRTVDGGKTWKKVLYVNDTTGVIDLVGNRKQPDTLYAATYDVQRYPWRLVEGGPGTGIHKTTDGGRTWTRLDGGLPKQPVGRIGLDIYQRNPNILYAILENFGKRPPTGEETKQAQARGQRAGERQIGGEVYRTDDGGRTWHKMNSEKDDVSNKAGYSFNQIRVDQNDDKRIILNQDSLLSSDDGGRSWTGLTWNTRNLFANAFGDFRTMWIDPQNSKRMILGSDGGVHVSYDGGKTCDHYPNIPGGEYYAVAVDMDDPYRIYGGLQDHDSWRGPINGWSGRVDLSDWVTVGDNDGQYNQVDPTDSRWVYNTYQWGGHRRVDQKMHTRVSIVPTRPAGQTPLRFNWTPPLRISPHNSQILYTGAQVLFRSLDRGDHWEEISPDLTGNDPSKISPPGSTVQYCTITTISESPLKPGVIWVGTDDGKVQVTRSHGAAWTDLTSKIAAAGGPADYWVTRVLASAYEPGTAYVTKSGHRFDRYEPLVFRTADFGATWTAIHSNLPAGHPANVIVEDAKDRDLLFIGTMGGVFVSVDRGGTWLALTGNMPVASVSDLVIHPRESDLVAATYGRGLWVGNIGWLREAKAGAFGEDAHFFAVPPFTPPGEGGWGNYEAYGDRHLFVQNDEGARLVYFLRDKPAGKVTITIANAAGQVVRTIEGPASAGLNRATWNARIGRAGVAPPGEYTATLQVAEKKFMQKVIVRARLP